MASPDDHAAAMRDLLNNKPEDDFLGLTPNEMHGLIYQPFDPGATLQINPAIPDAVLDQVNFLRLTEEFLKIIKRDGTIKLTPLGSLPKKVCVELYNHRFVLDELVEEGIYKMSKEADSNAIVTMHFVTTVAGLVRKVKGKLLLTKKSEEILKSADRNKLFRMLLFSFTEEFAWSAHDGYAELPIGNMGWAFTIYMLLKEGNVTHEAGYYAAKYIKAFPHFVAMYPSRDFGSPESHVIRCYSIRTFPRFLEWWGFVTCESKKSLLDSVGTRYVATGILGEVFRFNS